MKFYSTRVARRDSPHGRLGDDYVQMQRYATRPNPRPSHVLVMPIGARKKVVSDGGNAR